MRRRIGAALVATFTGFLIVSSAADGFTQPPGGKGKDGKGGVGPGGFGPGGEKRKIVKDFDKNGDGWLNKEERAAARESLKKGGGFGFGGPKGFGPKGGDMQAAKPGPKVTSAEVKNYPDAKLYDPTTLRTIFLEFENADWEAELQDFHGTDVEVPATLIVDGKKYPNVGVHFRGMSSYMMVPAGHKRSLNVSLDLADSKQRLYGYKTLNLLNSHEDSSMMSTVLYSYIACVRTIAEESLDWKKLGPVVADYRKLIEKDVEADTRKLDSFEAFKRNTDDPAPTGGAGRGGYGMNLRSFAEQRQKYLLNHPQVKKSAP